jgi:hypothetical protein
MHEAEGAFTQNTVTTLASQLPDKNIVIFHDQDSDTQFSDDAQHVHYELDIGLGFTQGYEIIAFTEGWFRRAGDGGWENWAIYGNWDDSYGDGWIHFYPRS